MSLIVYIFSVFCPCRRSSSALRVRSAGHALNLNKGCTKRQSLPNCQQNGRPGREYRPGKQDARCYFVRNGAATKVRRADAFLRKDRPTEPDAERHGKQLPQTRRPGFRGYKSRDPDLVETIVADAGIDIGGTLIGMHLRRVAIPVRLSIKKIGEANILCARTRPKYIGGARAVYQEL